MDSGSINFYKITFGDYVTVQGLIKGITPTETYSEHFDSDTMNSEQESASGPLRKKGRLSSIMKKALVSVDEN